MNVQNSYIVEAADGDDSAIIGAFFTWNQAMEYIRFVFSLTKDHERRISGYTIHRLPLGDGLREMSNLEFAWWGFYGDSWTIFEHNLDMQEPA